MIPAPLIDNQEALDDLVRRAGETGALCLDTEADSLHSYREKLCLIQITLGNEDLLIDPLAGLDMSGLFGLFTSRELVFHAADYDLRMLRRAGCPMPPAVFDTMLAARLTGRANFGLAALVSEVFGIELGKAARKADWGRRPLSHTMIEYARNDTHFLPELRQRLEDEIAALGRSAWLREWCDRTIAAASVPKVRDDETVWRIAGANKLQPRSLAILRELWFWRDELASRMDIPPFKVLRNDSLLDVAACFEATGRPDFPFRDPRRRDAVFAAYERAMAIPESDLPQRTRGKRHAFDPDFESRLEAFRRVRDATASKLNLESSLLGSKAALEQLARGADASEAGLMQWQADLLRV